MIEATQPRLKMILPRLDENELAALCEWSVGLETRHGIAAPSFCKWLDFEIEHEYRRRQSAGAIEAGSSPLPAMDPREVSVMLLALTARTYGPQSPLIGKFFDDVLMHCLALASVQLNEFQSLCEAIQKQAASEE